jgi:hypothetical protein
MTERGNSEQLASHIDTGEMLSQAQLIPFLKINFLETILKIVLIFLLRF